MNLFPRVFPLKNGKSPEDEVGIVTGKVPVSYWSVFPLSIVTVPEDNSAKFLAMVAKYTVIFRELL